MKQPADSPRFPLPVELLGDGNRVPLEASERAQALLLTEVPLREPVVQYGPFVMNTEKEIVQAIEDYQAGRLGEIAQSAVPSAQQ